MPVVVIFVRERARARADTSAMLLIKKFETDKWPTRISRAFTSERVYVCVFSFFFFFYFILSFLHLRPLFAVRS